MTEPHLVFDIVKNRMVYSRRIKHYDDQEEWADEDQLNDWAYDIDNDYEDEGK